MRFQLFRLSLAVLLLFFASGFASCFDKSAYLDLMEEALGAYTPEHINSYIDAVDTDGIKEHGFARLTSNLGILIAHGRLSDKKDMFVRMMNICVRELPVALEKNNYNRRHGLKTGEIGNDFAVKEICCCIVELEASQVFPKSVTEGWRAGLKDMKAENIYSVQPKIGASKASNWCVFGSASECARLMAGIGGDRAYADKYLSDQLRFFDENGMYMDPDQPMVYDLVTRLQFMAALNFGYDGPAKAAIEEQLLKSASLTLKLQSVTGEIPYGGRSNQFLHNETFLAAVCEFYASWMKSRGEYELAGRFKAAAQRAVASVNYWTSQHPVRHVKNRFPTETKYGCEEYAHFDKYMVTMGSWAYMAYRFADDSIKPATKPEKASCFVTSDRFHRILMNGCGYTVQFDVNAQESQDASGLGRIQKAGAPCVIAISAPCPVKKPSYVIDVQNDGGLAIAPLWDSYHIKSAKPNKLVLTDSGSTATWTTTISPKGVKSVVEGKGQDIVMTVPALVFDGESQTKIACDGKTLSISFNGWTCRYRTNGHFEDSGKIYGNRNGHLRRYEAKGQGKLILECSIFPL